MKRERLLTILIVAGLFIVLTAGTVLADGVTGVSVQPLTPEVGDIITVKGDLLGPNSEVEVRIIGMGEDIDLGEVQADAEGDYTAQFQLPDDLTPGTYQVKAVGELTATTQITVLGAGTANPNAMEQAPVLRERPFGESLVLVGVFGVLAALGVFFAQMTRRPRESTTA